MRRLASGSRHFGSSLPAFDKPTKATPTGFRVYRYVVDVHGQLFLHDTVPKNLTSCFKNTDFLDFFFKRLRPNPASRTASADYSIISRHDILHAPVSSLASDWSDGAPFNGDMTTEQAASDLYLKHAVGRQRRLRVDLAMRTGAEPDPESGCARLCFGSSATTGCCAGQVRCRRRSNPISSWWIRTTGTSIIHLPDQHDGSGKPTKIPQKCRGMGSELACSNLVLSRLAEGLDIDPDAFDHGVGGSIEWKGRRYKLGLLGKG